MTGRNPTRSQRLLGVWHDTPEWLRTATKISFAAAAVLLTIGVLADAMNWAPSEWGYFVNLYSSVTAFFVAVPTALIGLDAVSETRRTEADIRKANNQTVRAWIRFADAVGEYCSPQVMQVLVEKFQEPYRISKLIKKEIAEYVQQQPIVSWPSRPYVQSPEAGHDPEGYLVLRGKIEQARADVEAYLLEIRRIIGTERDNQIQWSHLRNCWRFFETEVQSRRDELDLNSLDDQTVAVISDRTTAETHPLADFHYQLRRPQELTHFYSRIGEFPGMLQDLLDRSEENLLQVASSDTMFMFRDRIDGADKLVSSATEARTYLEEMRSTVAQVSISSVVDR